ncbi:BTAD domain-containing putative transcriptional regulator [Actinomadura sp. DC4]|uniref:BTAD domain-containing putative transcriptional regulator n=1 Tax=Actinomadura sp. DC4 TaxID=3055069 RepID=UPI0025B0E0DF|nr:BTAD domain-containing putative transcriptional regulator [Actinomadura sp. DC4]MDN3356681.1 BTAD domain-containing putative transcriptional regulator [Actinomadura sp. DC4]
MWFGILGATEVRSADGGVVPVGGPRVRSLLALLLLSAGRPVTAERLIDGLYGEEPPSGAANALQSQVSRLRRGLGDAGDLVAFDAAGYRLAVDPDDVDAHRFERLLAEGRRAADPAEAARLLRAALDLWRGPAFADVSAAPFAAAQTARLEELRVSAVEERAEAELALGGHRDLVPELTALVTAYPLRERPRGLLMRALYGSGRQADALAVFDDARRTLAEDLGADPSPELTAVHLAVLRAEPEPVSAAPAGLPAQLTSFVGREEELQRIGGLLAAGRLVTLLGPGGAGKTRLAIEAAGQEKGEVRFVDLAPIGAGQEAAGQGCTVAQAVIEALGLRETGLFAQPPEQRPDPAGRLVAALSERRILLILDNCEHVIGNAARLAGRLLGACPGVRVLATSREPLGITGEALCPLPPLPLPPPAADAPGALGYPAIRLFADRAAAVRPGFDPAAEVETIQRICVALDGLPLAIELAAARLRALTVAEIAARLDDRFRLLSRGDRTKAPRHRTLRAVIEWSWDLLRDDERTLARRLTVFAGGATPEAVAEVCGMPAEEADELLADLVDKSLIEDSAGRYRMLDTIRAFCAERLAEAGERDAVHAAHTAYFLDLAETAEPYMRRAEQVEWLARLGADHGNLMAALRRAVHADRRLALRLLAAMVSYWWLRGLRTEGVPEAVELLGLIGPEPPAGLEEEYVLALMTAVHGGVQGPLVRDHRRIIESIMANLDPGHPPLRPMVTVLWAVSSGPTDADVELQERLMAQDPWSWALRHFGWGYIRMFSGDATGAGAEFEASVEGFRTTGDRWGLAGALTALARLTAARGEDGRSVALADEAFTLVSELGAAEDTTDLLCLRAERMTRAGDFTQARACYERAGEFARRSGAAPTVAHVRHGLAELARLSGDLAEARRQGESALSVCTSEAFGVHEVRARVLVGLGRVAEAEGDAAGAGSRYRQALALSAGYGDLRAVADVAEGMAGVALCSKDGERAALLLGAGTALRGMSVAGDPDVARVAGGARELIGDAAYASAFERGAELPSQEALALLG